MNTKDYVQELESQLKATFKKADGSTVPFYVKSNESELDKQKTELQKLIDLGNSQGFISDNDAKTMSPSGKAVRLYVQPKCHKEMKEKMNGLVIDRDLVKEALKGNDSSLEIVLTIKYQGIRLQRDQ